MDDWKMEDNYDSGSDDSQSEVERLAVLRKNYRQSVERLLYDILEDEVFIKFSKTALKLREERLSQQFIRYENADALYRQHDLNCTDQEFVRLEGLYLAALERIREKMAGSPDNTSNSDLGRSVPQTITVETIQPPQLTQFSGNPADWPAFRDLFRAEVHDKTMDPVKKLLYLQGACIDKAAKTLGPWQPTRENYTAAWETLVNAYDDNYHVIHGILANMYTVRRSDRESHDSLRVVLDTMTSGLRQLSTLISNEELHDQTWIHYAKQRLPKYTLDAWEQYRNRHGGQELPTLKEFQHFIDTKSKGRREYLVDSEHSQSKPSSSRSRNETNDERRTPESGSRSNSRPPPNNRSQGNTRFQPYDRNQPRTQRNDNQRDRRPEDGTRNISKPTGLCTAPGCTEKHPVYMCDIFRQMNLADRLKLVRQNRLCRCCLKSGHFSKDCTRDSCMLCPDAELKHNIKLCDKSRFNQPREQDRNRDQSNQNQ
jgi:hypothetical protein